MAKTRCILALDQGTSSTKAVLFGLDSQLHGVASVPVSISSPQTGWVEQDPEEIYQSVISAAQQVTANSDFDVAGLAITNQRESALAWDPETGKPLSPMLGWQDRRTANRVSGYTDGQLERIRQITGLPLDPMFSALKFAWILDQIDPDRSLASDGKIALGTVDSWLVYRLTGEHVVEVGNASRTQLLDLATGNWSSELLDLFNIPVISLPAVVPSDYQTETCTDGPFTGLPILAVLADSHAALYAHHASNGSNLKATFGTGSSVMALKESDSETPGLVTTVAWKTEGQLVLAAEGNILSSGSTLVWLGEVLGKSPAELADLAQGRLPSGISDGSVNLVPAFGGMGAPWWDLQARAVIEGMTLDTSAADLAVAAFEAVCMQIEDVVAAVDAASKSSIGAINVDGGPTSNRWLMQLMANLSQREISVSAAPELSAIGVAVLAARSAGLMTQANLTENLSFTPNARPRETEVRKASWAAAVERSRFNPSEISKK